MDPETMSRRNLIGLSMRAATVSVAAAMGLTGCESSEPSDGCVSVRLRHLAVARDGSGTTRVCNPQRVSPAYRERYFPGSSGRTGLRWTL